MYTIIPLLLAHIQELNKQILFLFKFIVKKVPAISLIAAHPVVISNVLPEISLRKVSQVSGNK